MDVWSQPIPGKGHSSLQSVFLWEEGALGKGSCAGMPAPHCQSEGSSVVCCLGSRSTAADRAITAPHCPSCSTFQRKTEPCQLSKRQRQHQAPLPPPPSLPSAGVRCQASISAGVSEIVQTVHPFLTVGAQTQPRACASEATSLPCLSVTAPTGVLRPCGLPDHPPTLRPARGMVRDGHSRCVGADFEMVQLSTASWFQ